MILVGMGLIIGILIMYWWLVQEGEIDALDPYMLISLPVFFIGVIYVSLGGK